MKTIPWDKVKIRFMDIEINHVPEGRAGVKRYMEQQGFKFYKKHSIDYFFYKPELADDLDLSFMDTTHFWRLYGCEFMEGLIIVIWR